MGVFFVFFADSFFHHYRGGALLSVVRLSRLKFELRATVLNVLFNMHTVN